MIIDREKSLHFVSYTGNLVLNLIDVGNNTKKNELFDYIYKNMISEKISIEIAKMNMEYLKKVDNADMNLFDEDFVKLYRKGTFEVRPTSKSYEMKFIYIYAGKQDNNKKIYLEAVEELGIDVLTGNKIENFEKESVTPLRLSNCFYEIYKMCRELGLYEDNKLIITSDIVERVADILSTYDGSRQNKVPETYYAS